MRRLGKWPNVSGARPLSGRLAGWYRIRTGDYRIRFAVVGNEVLIDRIAHRREMCEE
jgi:mRNA-degrading endonuclease RelE of RelBE toxin-antitoxin system